MSQGTGYMTTFTGRQFRYDAPLPEQLESICIEDIAHHLSLLCHWCGACRKFFSVAQHSVLVSTICPPELRAWGLMHDAAEAYCGDVIRPLKVLLPAYKEIETRVMYAIAEKFGLGWPEPPELKEYDNRALAIETRELMHDNEALHDGRGNLIRFDDLPSIGLIPLDPPIAEVAFTIRFAALLRGHPVPSLDGGLLPDFRSPLAMLASPNANSTGE